MLPPLPESNESEYDRFKRFAQALLAVPRSEIMPEEALEKLKAQKQRIDAKIAEVGQEMAKRKAKPPK
jgi:hypothetical protein